MKKFRTRIWEYSPSWDLRDVYIEAESQEQVIEYVKNGDLIEHIVDWGDCHETVVADGGYDWKYEPECCFEDNIEEVQ